MLEHADMRFHSASSLGFTMTCRTAFSRPRSASMCRTCATLASQSCSCDIRLTNTELHMSCLHIFHQLSKACSIQRCTGDKYFLSAPTMSARLSLWCPAHTVKYTPNLKETGLHPTPW